LKQKEGIANLKGKSRCQRKSHLTSVSKLITLCKTKSMYHGRVQLLLKKSIQEIVFNLYRWPGKMNQFKCGDRPLMRMFSRDKPSLEKILMLTMILWLSFLVP
jgi:hypothetical protein